MQDPVLKAKCSSAATAVTPNSKKNRSATDALDETMTDQQPTATSDESFICTKPNPYYFCILDRITKEEDKLLAQRPYKGLTPKEGDNEDPQDYSHDDLADMNRIVARFYQKTPNPDYNLFNNNLLTKEEYVRIVNSILCSQDKDDVTAVKTYLKEGDDLKLAIYTNRLAHTPIS